MKAGAAVIASGAMVAVAWMVCQCANKESLRAASPSRAGTASDISIEITSRPDRLVGPILTVIIQNRTKSRIAVVDVQPFLSVEELDASGRSLGPARGAVDYRMPSVRDIHIIEPGGYGFCSVPTPSVVLAEKKRSPLGTVRLRAIWRLADENQLPNSVVEYAHRMKATYPVGVRISSIADPGY